MPVNPGDAVRVTFRGSCFGQRIILDLSYRCSVGNVGLSTAAVLDELNAALVAPGGANNISTTYLLCLPVSYTMNECRSQVVNPVRSGFRSLAQAAPGGNAAAATTANDSAAVTRRTAFSGRNQISTLKVGPAPDATTVAGILTAAYQAALLAFGVRTLQTILLPISTCQFVPTILTQAGVAGLRDLTNVVVGTTQRVMRRRTVGVGE